MLKEELCIKANKICDPSSSKFLSTPSHEIPRMTHLIVIHLRPKMHEFWSNPKFTDPTILRARTILLIPPKARTDAGSVERYARRFVRRSLTGDPRKRPQTKRQIQLPPGITAD